MIFFKCVRAQEKTISSTLWILNLQVVDKTYSRPWQFLYRLRPVISMSYPPACNGGGAASIISKGKKAIVLCGWPVCSFCWQCTPLAWQSDIENMYVLYVVYTSIININNWIEDILNVVGNTSQKAGWSREMERLHHKLNFPTAYFLQFQLFQHLFSHQVLNLVRLIPCDDFNAVWNLLTYHTLNRTMSQLQTWFPRKLLKRSMGHNVPRFGSDCWWKSCSWVNVNFRAVSKT